MSNNFKINDTVVCIEDNKPYNIMVGNHYKILDIGLSSKYKLTGVIKVKCDDNTIYWFNVKHFITIEDHREITIKNIIK